MKKEKKIIKRMKQAIGLIFVFCAVVVMGATSASAAYETKYEYTAEYDTSVNDIDHLVTWDEYVNGDYDPDRIYTFEEYAEATGTPYIKLGTNRYLAGKALEFEKTSDSYIINCSDEFIITYNFIDEEVFVAPAPGVTGDDAIFGGLTNKKGDYKDLYLLTAPSGVATIEDCVVRDGWEAIRNAEFFDDLSAKQRKEYKEKYNLKYWTGWTRTPGGNSKKVSYVMRPVKFMVYDVNTLGELSLATIFTNVQNFYFEDGITGIKEEFNLQRSDGFSVVPSVGLGLFHDEKKAVYSDYLDSNYCGETYGMAADRSHGINAYLSDSVEYLRENGDITKTIFCDYYPYNSDSLGIKRIEGSLCGWLHFGKYPKLETFSTLNNSLHEEDNFGVCFNYLDDADKKGLKDMVIEEYNFYMGTKYGTAHHCAFIKIDNEVVGAKELKDGIKKVKKYYKTTYKSWKEIFKKDFHMSFKKWKNKILGFANS